MLKQVQGRGTKLGSPERVEWKGGCRHLPLAINEPGVVSHIFSWSVL